MMTFDGAWCANQRADCSQSCMRYGRAVIITIFSLERIQIIDDDKTVEIRY